MGIDNLGVGANRNAQFYNWDADDESNVFFSFVIDTIAKTLTSSVGSNGP